MQTRLLCFQLALTLLVSISPAAARADGEPAKLAGAARFDVTADARTGSIDHGQVVEGNGSIERMNWVSESARTRGYTVNFPVTHLGCVCAGCAVQPVHTGTVTLTLMGPVSKRSRGRCLPARGSLGRRPANGAHGGRRRFPNRTRARPWLAKHWWRGLRSPRAWRTIKGTHFAQTWHNDTLHDVQRGWRRAGHDPAPGAGVRVGELHEMKTIVSRTTPATSSASGFSVGQPGQRTGITAGTGLGRPLHPRGPSGHAYRRDLITWHSDPGGSITRDRGLISDPSRDFRPGRSPGQRGPARGAGVMTNIHHFDDFTSHPQETARFLGSGQVARHFEQADGLVFELLNEPRDAATTEVINPVSPKRSDRSARSPRRNARSLSVPGRRIAPRAPQARTSRRRPESDRDGAQLRTFLLHASGSRLGRS